jgi:3-oxoacyl-[acyl-carrier protein] reductase
MIARKSGGVIVNINSGAGKMAFENLPAYCASKFGLMGLAESASLEVNRYNNKNNIRIMSVIKTRCLNLKKVAERIVEMIFDAKSYKNGDVVDMYNEW